MKICRLQIFVGYAFLGEVSGHGLIPNHVGLPIHYKGVAGAACGNDRPAAIVLDSENERLKQGSIKGTLRMGK